MSELSKEALERLQSATRGYNGEVADNVYVQTADLVALLNALDHWIEESRVSEEARSEFEEALTVVKRERTVLRMRLEGLRPGDQGLVAELGSHKRGFNVERSLGTAERIVADAVAVPKMVVREGALVDAEWDSGNDSEPPVKVEIRGPTVIEGLPPTPKSYWR